MQSDREKFVYYVSRRSFLSLWSYHSPKGKGGKELCDILVVCDPDVVIVSVKDVQFKDTGNPSVEWKRWQRRAIDESVKQIYGAERWIGDAQHVVKSDGTDGLPFPVVEERRVHRIAVALGSEGKAPLKFGDFGKGFVHVLDEHSFRILLNELDTITDFVEYLVAKEALVGEGTELTFLGAEEDLLAWYLHHGGSFQANGADSILITPGIWDGFCEKPEVIAKKKENKISYAWDRLVEELAVDVLTGYLEFGSTLSENEQAIRLMAREDRFSRKVLSEGFIEFLENTDTIRSRKMSSPSGMFYIFLAVPHGEDPEYLKAELGGRCFAAKSQHPEFIDIVGIATQKPEKGKGHSMMVMYLHLPSWTDEDAERTKAMAEELGYFTNPIETKKRVEEYPSK